MTTVLENKGFKDKSVLRAANLSDELRSAREAFKKSPGHFTAVGVQRALAEQDSQVEKNRERIVRC